MSDIHSKSEPIPTDAELDQLASRYVIWWLNSEEAKITNANMPKGVTVYIRDELKRLVSFETGKARIWVPKYLSQYPETATDRVIDWPDNPITQVLSKGDYGGIVIRKEDAHHLLHFPGLLTDFYMRRWFGPDIQTINALSPDVNPNAPAVHVRVLTKADSLELLNSLKNREFNQVTVNPLIVMAQAEASQLLKHNELVENPQLSKKKPIENPQRIEEIRTYLINRFGSNGPLDTDELGKFGMLEMECAVARMLILIRKFGRIYFDSDDMNGSMEEHGFSELIYYDWLSKPSTANRECPDGFFALTEEAINQSLPELPQAK